MRVPKQEQCPLLLPSPPHLLLCWLLVRQQLVDVPVVLKAPARTRWYCSKAFLDPGVPGGTHPAAGVTGFLHPSRSFWPPHKDVLPIPVPTPHLPRSWMASSNLFSSMAFCTSFVLGRERCSTMTLALAGRGAGPPPSRPDVPISSSTHHLDALHQWQPHRLVPREAHHAGWGVWRGFQQRHHRLHPHLTALQRERDTTAACHQGHPCQPAGMLPWAHPGKLPWAWNTRGCFHA